MTAAGAGAGVGRVAVASPIIRFSTSSRARIALVLALLAFGACVSDRPAYVPGGGSLSEGERDRWESAELAAAAGQRDKAIGLLEVLVGRHPDHVPSRLLMQDLLLERDGPEIVRASTAAAAKARPDDWIARLLAARLEPDVRRRLAAYRRVRQGASRSPWAHLAVADAALTVSEMEEETVRETRQRGTVEDRKAAVTAALARDRALDEAREAVESALAIDPDLVPALRRRGEVLRLDEERETDPSRRRSLQESRRKVYDEALSLAPRDLPSLVARAALHRQRNDYASARRDLMRAIELRPWDPDLHQNLGVVAYEMGEMAQAEKAFRNAVRLEPRNLENLRNLGDTLAERKKLQDARERYEAALGYAPDDPALLERMGNLLVRLNKPERALDYYRRYLQVGGPDRSRVEAAMRKVESGASR